jgi:hypothetical protein
VEQSEGTWNEEHEALMAANQHAEQLAYLLGKVQRDEAHATDIADRISEENKQWYRQMKRYMTACSALIRRSGE